MNSAHVVQANSACNSSACPCSIVTAYLVFIPLMAQCQACPNVYNHAHAQVKTSAVLVLLLIEAAGSSGHRKVLGSGADIVTLLEMLAVANSWPASSAQQLPQQPSAPADLHTLSEADPAHTVPPEVVACSPFVAACSTLLHRLVYSSLQELAEGSLPAVSALQETYDTLMLVNTLNFVTMAFAVGTCNWQSAQQSPSKPRFPRKLMQWWRRRTLIYSPIGWYWLVGKTLLILGFNPGMSTSRMLWLADRVRKQQQAARDIIEDSEAVGVEDIIKGVTEAVLQVENNRRIAFGPQGQRDALVRCSHG